MRATRLTDWWHFIFMVEYYPLLIFSMKNSRGNTVSLFKYPTMTEKKATGTKAGLSEKTSRTREKSTKVVKPVAAEKKPKVKKEVSPEVLEQQRKIIARVLGVLFIFLGIFLFVCFVLPYSTGVVGKWLYESFNSLFGYGIYVFPLILFHIGIQLSIKGSKFTWSWILLFFILLYIDAVVLMQFITGKGGTVGSFMAGKIIQVIGKAGGYLMLIFIGIGSLMLLTQLTFKQVLKGMYAVISFTGKIIEKTWHFLTFRAEDPDKEKALLDPDMHDMPDLAVVVNNKAAKVKAANTDKTQDEPDEEMEEDEDEEPSDQPKKVVFFEETDFDEDSDEDDEDEDDDDEVIMPPAESEEPDDQSEEIYLLPDEAEEPLDEEKTDEMPVPKTPKAPKDSNDPKERDTFEITGGKPTGYEELNLFGEGGTKKAGTSKDKPETVKKPVKDYKYHFPSLNLLSAAPQKTEKSEHRDDSKALEETLANFGVEVKVINIIHGPAVTRYELQPAKGVKVRKITNLSNDIALALAAYSIRIEAPIPGKAAIGIEVPNRRIEPVFLRDLLYDAKYKKLPPLSLALGKDITGKAVVADLLKMPHLLVAGATGSGKSVCVNSIVGSILYKATPLDVQLVMVDPKRVELSLYEGIPHLVDIKLPGGKKIITDPKAATMALKTLSEIMDLRYEDFVALKVRNIKEFNEKAEIPIPYIVIIIDELADLMMVSSSTVEQYICRIAQLGRASGIHLIVATQRPSVDVITGLIKANIPSRIAFAVSSQVDSRTILDRVGAEKLLGKGDMLYLPVDASEPRRIQGAYVSGEEIEKVVEFWKQQPPPENIIPIEISEMSSKGNASNDDETEDDLLPDAIEVIKTSRQASVSNLQRKMKIGYARAGRIMDQLERKGIVGPAQGSKPRKIMLPGFTDYD